MADEENKHIDKKVERIFSEIADEIKNKQEVIDDENDVQDAFDEYVVNSVTSGVGEPNKVAFTCGGCDSCKRKQIITEQYYRVTSREYIPPYVDKDCRDFRIALVIDRLDEQILERAVSFLLLRTSIDDVVSRISKNEWKDEARNVLRNVGFKQFFDNNFGKLTKVLIGRMMFDVNYCCFNPRVKKNLNKSECTEMIKFYIIAALRDNIKEDLYKFAKIVELELEYKIAVIEGEIKYIIKCLLQELVISPLPMTNYNINFFNKIGSLTEVLKLMNGFEGGKHDQHEDFRSIRNTIKKYQKVVETSFDLLNKKIKEYECLINQRILIVGITGICETTTMPYPLPKGKQPIMVPPVPIVVLNPPSGK